MTRFFIYLKYEMKKGMALIPFFVVSALIAGGALIAAAVIFCAVMDERGLFPKAEVAIVAGSDGTDDSSDERGRIDLQTKLAIGMVEGMESVKSICRFSYLSPKEAAEGLASGKIDAALYMPDGMYDDINTGRNTPVLIRLSAKQEALSQNLFRQLIVDGVSLIRAVESAVYPVDRMSADYPTVGTLGEAEDRIFSLYLQAALGRNAVFSGSGVSLYGSLTMKEFYASSAILYVMLLFGIGFSTLYSEGEREAVRYLRREGLRSYAASFAKMITMGAVLLILLFAISLFVNAGLHLQTAEGESFTGGLLRRLPQSAQAIFRGLPLMLLIAITMGVFIHIVYLLAGSRKGALIYFLVITALFALTGGLLPLPYLPQGLARVLSVTPIPLWQKGIALILS